MTDLPEFKYLEAFVRYRLDRYFDPSSTTKEPKMPPLSKWGIHIPEVLKQAKLQKQEKIVVLLALCPHIASNLLDQIIQGKLAATGDFPQLGGVRGKNFRGFLPTGQTALFLLDGDNFKNRKPIYELFGSDHLFAKKHILWLEEASEGEPVMSGKLVLSSDYIELFVLGKMRTPRFSMKFPAELITTEMEWDDLVLNEETQRQVSELQTWVTYGDTLLDDWGLGKKIKPGYRALFYGPPGTGKTLTANLLGKYTGKQVYRIDLSMVVSKFIGETEKNLSNLLAKAEKTDNILFCDECDALFGKRTSVRDAHDKYANQEVSYLLQRIEGYKGLVILASNFKSNIDEAFIRRFQSIVHFPMPKAAERLILWEKAFPSVVKLSPDLDLGSMARKYEISGAEIMNVVQYACLCALEEKKKTITASYITSGIRREFQKGGRIMR